MANSEGMECGSRHWQNSLQIIDETGLYPRIPLVSHGLSTPIVCIAGREYLSFAGNDYLGMAVEPRTAVGAIKAIEAAGVGPGHSRAIGGTPILVDELETLLAEWTGFEQCVTFPTGYMANVSVIQALLRPLLETGSRDEAVVFLDQASHGSLVDGCKLAQARIVPYRHDDLGDLKRRLNRHASPNSLIVTEGVFCLEGTLIDLQRYVDLAKTHGCQLMVDDAHGIGIIGKNGGGIGSLLPATDGIDLYMGSMDKALGSTGGFLCGKSELIRYLRIACRSQILSSCLPMPIAGSVIEAIKIIRGSGELIAKTINRAQSLKHELTAIDYEVLGNINHPSVSVFIGDDQLGICFEERLWDLGCFQPVIRWPAVPHGKSRFRLNVTALHTDEQVGRIVSHFHSLRPLLSTK